MSELFFLGLFLGFDEDRGREFPKVIVEEQGKETSVVQRKKRALGDENLWDSMGDLGGLRKKGEGLR